MSNEREELHRRQLVAQLRQFSDRDDSLFKLAADEIERLRAGPAATPAKPAAWGRMIDGEAVTVSRIRTGANDEPLYAAPPAPAATPAPEPFAWVVLSDETGNTRMWTRNGDIAKAFAEKHLLECVELYRTPLVSRPMQREAGK